MRDEIAEAPGARPGAGQDRLIEILLETQKKTGCLSEEVLIEVGRRLNMPPARVFGIATFYSRFRFTAPGKHIILLCSGTACHVNGSESVLDAVKSRLGIGPGQTTRDGRFSLETGSCLGACALSPLLCVDGEFHARVTPNRALSLIEEMNRKEEEDAEKAGAV